MNNKIKLLVTAILLLSVQLSAKEDVIPPLNKKVIEYINTIIGKKVDRGECWDLAFRALEYADAKLVDTYVFGRKLKKGEKIYPGDIIQFENVIVEREIENGIMVQDIPHHTAIVYEVLGDLDFQLADQNNGVTGKKVSINPLNLNGIKKGKFIVYRPIAK